MSREDDAAKELRSSREQELRLLVETIPTLVGRAGFEDKVEFTAQLQAVLNLLPAYVWYAAPSGALTFVNKRTADYLSIPNDNPLRFGIDIGAQWDDWVPMLHPDDQEESRKYWSNSLRTGEPGEHTYRVRSAQGDYRWFLSRYQPLRASDGSVLLWVGATLDIEELKRAEQALRENEYKLRQIIEAVPGLVWSNGPDGEPTHVNQRMLDYAGMRFDDFKHRGWETFVHPIDYPDTARAFYHAIQTGTAYEGVMRLRRVDGEFRWHQARCEPLVDGHGQIMQWYGLSFDIDERKRAEQALRDEQERLRQLESELAHMNRLSIMGELAASLAHEIAQPIATARNNARAALHFLERNVTELAQVREALTCVVDDTDRSGQILDRIRDHIKKAPPRKERVDLNQAITDVIALAQGAILKNGVSVRTNLTDGLSPVKADRVQLQQVVLNLILNAIEAMGSVEQGVGELSIATERHEAGGVLVSVRDSGPGIASKNFDRIFDAFYTTKSSGVGMGLSICRSIINAHGGRLWADVNAPRGALFRFTLPGTGEELMRAQWTREPHEDTVAETARRQASEGNR